MIRNIIYFVLFCSLAWDTQSVDNTINHLFFLEAQGKLLINVSITLFPSSILRWDWWILTLVDLLLNLVGVASLSSRRSSKVWKSTSFISVLIKETGGSRSVHKLVIILTTIYELSTSCFSIIPMNFNNKKCTTAVLVHWSSSVPTLLR